MPQSIPFGQVTIGGDHSDNPSDYNWRNYDNYPGLDLSKTYVRIDVIIPHDPRPLQLTCLAVVIGGYVQTGPNDACIQPCPPFC